MKDGALALIVVKEQGRKAIARAGVDDDGTIPPAEARRPNKKRIDGAHGNRKGVSANGPDVACYGRRRRHKVRLLRGRLGVGQVDLDVYAGRVPERRLGHPGQEEVRRGRRRRLMGVLRRGAAILGGLLLQQGDVPRDVVLGRGGGMDIYLGGLISFGGRDGGLG